MEEKKIENERNEDESQQNKKWIESLGFKNLPVEERRTNEEWMKNSEEWRKTVKDLLTEMPQKCYGSTSTWIFLTETIFFTKTAEMHSQGDDGYLEQPPFAYL